MIFCIILYLLFFLIAWILYEISYMKSKVWSRMLRSPYQYVANIFVYGCIGLGISFWPKLLINTLSVNKTAIEWIGHVIAIIIPLIFMYVVKRYYHQIQKNIDHL